MPNDSPAVAVSPNNIQYLSFQGGGGKGTANLGALAWLEKNSSRLPLYSGQGSGSSIIGVSGASAGAITALFVALGYSSSSILGTLTQTDIGDLVDGPEPGVYCSDPSNLIQNPEIAEAITNAIIAGSAAVLPVLAEEVPGLGPAIAALPAILQPLILLSCKTAM